MPVDYRSGYVGARVVDFDQLFEHAIMHLHRHRRQIERWLAEAP